MTAFLQAALGLLLQSTGLLLLGIFALWLARRPGPAVQSLVGRAALAGVALLLLIAPLTGHVQSLWHVALPAGSQPISPPPQKPAPSSARPSDPTPPYTHSSQDTHSSQAASPPETGRARDLDKKPLAVGGLTSSSSRLGRTPVTEERGNKEVTLPYSILSALWGVGTTVLLLWLGLCQWHLTRLRRSAHPVTSGPATAILAGLTTHPPPLLAHPAVHSPFLAGLRHPTIFLPVAYEAEFDPAALCAILTHELAHLARRDNAWTLVARLLCAALWPQPLLWVFCRRLEQIGEEACDQAVLAQNCSPRIYADCLLTLAEHHPLGYRERTLGAGVAPFRSSLGRRIGRILDKGTYTMSTISPRLRLSVAAGVVAAALAGAFLVSASPTVKPARMKVVAVTPSVALPERERHQIIGKVVYEDGRPAPGVAVMARMTNESQGKLMAQHKNYLIGTSADTTSRTDGSFTLRNLREGSYDVMEREASGKWVARAIENVSVSHAVTSVPNLLLTSGAVITGTVTNKQTRKPMPEMYVYSLGPRYPASMGGSSSTQTDADGKYSLRVVPGDNWIYISGLGKNQGYVTGQIGISPMSRNLKYPVYDRGFHVLVSKGKTRVTPIYAVPTPPPAQARITAAEPSVPANPELSEARFLAGLTPVQGPGVVVILNDSKKPLPKGLPTGLMSPGLIHDTDINQVVNELKAAGAEAIAVNDQRLVATTPIRTAGPVILINFTPTTPPYFIKAIGNSKTLASALNIRGGIATQLKAYDSAMFSIREAEGLTLPACFGGNRPHYAKPLTALQIDAASVPASPQLRTFTVMFRVPRQGTHRFEVYLVDTAGQHLISSETYQPGEKVTLPVTAQAGAVGFRIYDNGKLTKTQQFRSAASGGSEPRYAKPVTSISGRQEQDQASVDFLNAQIKDSEPRLRKAEVAVSVYKATHPLTLQNQRQLADLTRNYTSMFVLVGTLINRRNNVRLQASLAQLTNKAATSINAKGAKASPEAAAAKPEVKTLRQQRVQLNSQLVQAQGQAAMLSARIQAMRTRIRLEAKKLTPPLLPGTKAFDQTDFEKQALAKQIAAAQADLSEKEANMKPRHPARIVAQRKLQSLEKAYQQLPIREKQQFVEEVHQYHRVWIASYNQEADREREPSHQLNKARKKIQQIRADLAALNAQITPDHGSGLGN